MLSLVARRSDLYHVIGLPDPATVSREQLLSRSTSILLSDAALYKRTNDTGLPRVMIVGDSQALSLGYGLDQWATQNKRAVVWNRGLEGCGVAVDGETRSFGSSNSGLQRCRDAAAAWPGQIKAFQPRVVIVLSSLTDIQDRRLPGSSKFSSIGDAAFDAFLVKEYEHVVDTLSATGARVVWMRPPCTGIKAGSAGQPSPYDSTNIDLLNTKILPEVARERSSHVAMFDLAGVVCPGGKPLTSVAGVQDVRPDGVHFSVDGSVWFVRDVRRAVAEARRPMTPRKPGSQVTAEWRSRYPPGVGRPLVEPLAWDSEFFGFPIGRADLEDATPEKLEAIDSEAREHGDPVPVRRARPVDRARPPTWCRRTDIAWSRSR